MCIRDSNGPELTAHALRDWCTSVAVTTRYIEPGAPWQNPFAESFNARVRDELLNLEEFSCLTEAQVLAEDWRQEFNGEHPHSALGYRSPSAKTPTVPGATTHRLSHAVDQQPGSGHMQGSS